MSVFIKNMRMPTSCHECIAAFGGFCYVAPSETDGECVDHGRPEWCPLIELPPHGRLIDADALIARIRRAKELQPELSDLYENEALEMLLWVGTEPTIIEAEEVSE